jgi:transcriptional regulator with XRE-family HTH domain/Zn-dependent peptidase ImmA (M78 family)
MTENATRWSEKGYADVVAADGMGAEFEVDFDNGDTVVLAAGLFGVPDVVEARPDEDGLGVVLRGAAQEVVVSWSQLRAAADPEFAHELRRRDAEEARRVGLRLRALREDRNLNQRDVAGLVGMTPPQLSKIESGSFDLRISTVQSLLRAMGASLGDITGPDVPEVSRKVVEQRGEKAGIPRDIVRQLLAGAPRRATAAVMYRAFGWDLTDLAAGRTPEFALQGAVAFKTTRKGEDPSSLPAAHLGQTIADITRKCFQGGAFHGLPTDPATVHRQTQDAHGRVTLRSLTQWLWQQGVPVVPLAGRGGFAAAVWNSRRPPVIVIKETRELAVFWLFDLAHEVAHLALGHVGDSGIVDVESPAPYAGADQSEKAADEFALALLLPGHRNLLSEVRREARGSHLRFKGAVASIAASANVSAGLLGMIAAYELTEVGEYKDRWGSSTNLARTDGNGRDQVQAIARTFLSTNALDETDAILMSRLALDA